MSKKKNKSCCEKKCGCERKHDNCCCSQCCSPCCCETSCCCCSNNNNNNYGNGFGLFGGNGSCSAVAPIIFLLIACGSGLLNCGSSYLIILLFILFGGCFTGNNGSTGNCCC
ncbi:hypothetical protein [uncultured Clostridium sp.]|uniref:hypothetical protein n=1 Tax=uncultured Clostridium sp. TaxID=59620 RepID=UPI0025E30421|nr:hypothetical protein [uncultured Clostridium sp.]